jgi:hypothetical protein
VPLLYALLLWRSADAIRTGRHTHLSRATSFLSSDYSSFAFWWEPLEMCRKLLLSQSCRSISRPQLATCTAKATHVLHTFDLLLAAGWLVLIDDRSEHARILVALLASIFFLSLRLTIRPLRR